MTTTDNKRMVEFVDHPTLLERLDESNGVTVHGETQPRPLVYSHPSFIVPDIGSRVRVKTNRVGDGKVVGYVTESTDHVDFIGLIVHLDRPYFNGNKLYECCTAFGAEVEHLTDDS